MPAIPDPIIQLAQKCMAGMPVVVLGSGASIPYGVGSMTDLQRHLLATVTPDAADEAAWTLFKESIARTNDLEQSLQETTLPSSLIRLIVRETRTCVLTADLNAFKQVVANPQTIQLSRLYRHLFNSTHNTLSVVTTNYDRLAEYAADAAGYLHDTGFTAGFYRSFASPATRRASGGQHRTVQVWKVHGSVDWYVDESQVALSLPFEHDFPETLTPLLVTPGTTKYEQTHQEPFRSIITQADQALDSANGYLCVGYGFNDIHIQPKLVHRVRTHAIPIVIVARTLTSNALEFLAGCPSAPYLALEQHGTGTRAFYCEEPNGIEIPDSALWEFPRFLDAVFGT